MPTGWVYVDKDQELSSTQFGYQRFARAKQLRAQGAPHVCLKATSSALLVKTAIGKRGKNRFSPWSSVSNCEEVSKCEEVLYLIWILVWYPITTHPICTCAGARLLLVSCRTILSLLPSLSRLPPSTRPVDLSICYGPSTIRILRTMLLTLHSLTRTSSVNVFA